MTPENLAHLQDALGLPRLTPVDVDRYIRIGRPHGVEILVVDGFDAGSEDVAYCADNGRAIVIADPQSPHVVESVRQVWRSRPR